MRLLLTYGFLCLSLISFAQNFSPQQQKSVDSLKAIIMDPNQPDSTIIETQIALAWFYYLPNPDTAIIICTDAYNWSIEADYDNGILQSCGWLGYLASDKGDYQMAIDYTEVSLEISKEMQDTLAVARSYNSLAAYYRSQGKLTESIEMFHYALKIREAMGDDEGAANSLMNIAFMHYLAGDTAKSLDYYERSYDLNVKVGDKKEQGEVLNQIGRIYFQLGDTVTSWNYWQRADSLFQEIEYIRGQHYILNNKGEWYEAKGENEKALEYYLASLELASNIGLRSGQSVSLNFIANYYMEQGDYERARPYIEQSLANAKSTGEARILTATSYFAKEFYSNVGEYKNALDVYQLHMKLKDSLNTLDIQKDVAEQDAKYLYEKNKVIVDAQHEKDLAIQEEAGKRQVVISAAAGVGLLLVIAFVIFVFKRLKITREQKKLIEEQKLEVEEQKERIVEAHSELEEKNREITDSITYAKRIQSAILPSDNFIKEKLPNSFVIYKPKDIVAGDFYWMTETNDQLLVAAADCTGHGVPGAMVSVVCHNALNRSVREYGLSNPAKILDKTREIVIQEFEKSTEEVKDGMDIALLAIQKNIIQYAGAHNPLWIIKKGANEILEIKADKQPIGKFEDAKPFNSHQVELAEGDMVYIFSDGFMDQFGGEKGKKLKSKGMRELLLQFSKENLQTQKVQFNQFFENWKGSFEQLDDVCVIGIRI